MVLVKAKGHEFNAISISNSYNRRAQQLKNNIISSFKKIGLTEDDVEIKLENMAIKKLPASASWYFDNHHMHYSYKAANKYVDNLYIVAKVLELEVAAILDGTRSPEEFVKAFTEEEGVEKERKEARELLGLDEHEIDVDVINKAYKTMAKGLHPDMPGGDIDKFKALNRAHKALKRELE